MDGSVLKISQLSIQRVLLVCAVSFAMGFLLAPVVTYGQSPEVMRAVERSAELYAQGRYAEAEPLYKRSLAIWEGALGPEHPNVATALENYSVLLRETGRYDEATEMEARAAAIRAKHAAENP